MSSAVLLGLDVSLVACAAVACPLDWGGDWARVRSVVVGRHLRRDASDVARVRRTDDIARRIVAFAHETDASVAWVESYAFGQASYAHSLGEIGGVLRLELHRAGLALHTAPISSARKLLLGKLPRTDAKGAVAAALRSLGCLFDTSDECDAFAAVNWGLAQLGGLALAQAA